MEWSDEELQMLLDLRSQGMSWQEVADALANEHEQRTPNACRKGFYRHCDNQREELSEAALEELDGEDIENEETGESISEFRLVPTSNSLWSDDEMMILHALKSSGVAYKEIAEILAKSCGKRTYNDNVCKKKWNDTDWNCFLNNRRAQQELRDKANAETNEKQRVIEETLAAHERLIRREETRTQIIVDSIKSSIYRLPKPKPSEFEIQANNGPYSYEHMGVMLSDLHVGAKFTLEETGGLGEYDVEIFKRRMNKLKESVLEIATRHRHMYQIPQLHVFSLGDVVAGMNDAGAWSSSYINMDIFDQTLCGMAAIRDTLATWARHFDKVVFYGVMGNHGRVGHKGTHKHSSNWDRVSYCFVEESLKEYPNIEFKIPTTWWLYETIQNHTFFISHGDNIRGSMGIPYYGVERTQSRVSGLLPTKPHYSLMGHFHSANELSTNFGKVLMNGSFMGGDIYSLKELSRADRPEQKLFGIHHKKGVTWSYNIHLDEG